jgi:NitT/TauT family transport system permease protein
MTAVDAKRPVMEAAPAPLDDAVSAAPPATSRRERILKVVIPIAMLLILIGVWEAFTDLAAVPSYKLPSPRLVAAALVDNWRSLGASLLVTLQITFMALALAVGGGVFLAVLMAQSKWIELAIYPYMVVLQVTPIIALAPLLIIWTPTTQIALLILAWVVAFFPILSNTTQGLKSTDHNLLNLFELYGANRWQTLVHLKMPNALPYFLVGLRIGGGLALIAAVVAEFAAGSAGKASGLAFRLLEAGYRLKIPLQFAALLLLSFTGVLIFFATTFVSWLLLRKWHESAVRREN